MKTFEYLEKLQLLHRLVRDEQTGTPREFADRLGISRATLYNIIDELNSRGLDVKYSKTAKTFFYGISARLGISFSIYDVESLSPGEAVEIEGGGSSFCAHAILNKMAVIVNYIPQKHFRLRI